MKIEYQNGRIVEVENPSVARKAVLAEYPDAIFGDDWEQINDRTRRLLAWENEEAAKEDDGSHAIAGIWEVD